MTAGCQVSRTSLATLPEHGRAPVAADRYVGPMSRDKIYTKAGDDGTTGLFYGGRVPKDSPLPTAYGTVDEAQAVLGLARAQSGPGSPVDEMLVPIMRDLYVLMAELATALENRHKLQPGASSVTPEMVVGLEHLIDRLDDQFEHPTEFVVPGGNVVGAWLDLGRTVVRRAERESLHAAEAPSQVVPYLNRLSDLLWTMARWHEGTSLTARA